METDGTINNYVKQEQSMIRREAARLVKFFEGIHSMEKLPGAMFVVDIKREHNAVAEARRLQDSRRGDRGYELRSRTSWIIRSRATTTPSARCG